MTAYRVLVTGSRDWQQPEVIRRELDEACIALLSFGTEGGDLIVVHGAASGADTIAHRYAETHRWTSEPHPADWSAPCRPTCRPGHRRRNRRSAEFCPAAGMYRNQLMVDLGADLCLAFIKDHSAGATGCAAAAEKAGITTGRIFDCACHPMVGAAPVSRKET